jgi:hypothetical protein
LRPPKRAGAPEAVETTQVRNGAGFDRSDILGPNPGIDDRLAVAANNDETILRRSVIGWGS